MLVSPLWKYLVSTAIAFAWILPNHTFPWLSFQTEAWISFCWLAVAVWVHLKGSYDTQWKAATLFILAISVIPLLQLQFGLIRVTGVAWINFAYLLGFYIAVRTGELIEGNQPGEGVALVYESSLIGALLSFVLQIYQKLNLDYMGYWIMAAKGRTHANIAQPNHLATLLMLGILGVAWKHYRKEISDRVAIILAVALIAGLALTDSRAGVLNIIVCTGFILMFRRQLPDINYSKALWGLFTWFFVVFIGNHFLSVMLSGKQDLNAEHNLVISSADSRLFAWKFMSTGLMDSPLWGYGWGPLFKIQIAQVASQAGKAEFFSDAHNLILDLMLWNGIPVGLLIAGFLFLWFLRAVLKISDFERLLYVLPVLVLLIHSLVEFPLNYTYFLLPFGILIGSTEFRHKTLITKVMHRKALDLSLLIVMVLIFALSISDYFNSEKSFYRLRLDLKGQDKSMWGEVGNIYLIDQIQRNIEFARSNPTTGVTESKLQEMQDTVEAYPSALIVFKLAEYYALSGNKEKAEHWLNVLCKLLPKENCVELKGVWQIESQRKQSLKNIKIPSIE